MFNFLGNCTKLLAVTLGLTGEGSRACIEKSQSDLSGALPCLFNTPHLSLPQTLDGVLLAMQVSGLSTHAPPSTRFKVVATRLAPCVDVQAVVSERKVRIQTLALIPD
jgi:hypothetical protein